MPVRTILTVAALLAAAIATPAQPSQPSHQPSHRPVIFVHGSTGSASQYETQARRFASNGYDEDLIEGHDYDSTFATENVATVFTRLDERIARLLAQTGADRGRPGSTWRPTRSAHS
jgi:hypothetical protein